MLVVLVGPAGSGKSTWAAANCRPGEVVSSDAIRGQVGENEMDQRANADAFAVLDDIVQRRLARSLLTVIDATSLDAQGRAKYRSFAQSAGVPCVAVAFPTDAATCRRRNKARPQPVPAAALTKQLADFAAAAPLLASEGFDAVYDAPGMLRRTLPGLRSPEGAVAPGTSPG